MAMSFIFGLRACAVALGAVALSACQSHPIAPTAVPALMVASKTDAQCVAQMQGAAQRPGVARVVLTPAAFAVEDRLSIVPADTVLDAAGQPASGRLRGLPDSFRLTLNNGVCTMVREADAQTSPLTACTCVTKR
jgi:hypothetical protein